MICRPKKWVFGEKGSVSGGYLIEPEDSMCRDRLMSLKNVEFFKLKLNVKSQKCLQAIYHIQNQPLRVDKALDFLKRNKSLLVEK